MAVEPYYVTFTKPPPSNPEILPSGYAVIEAVSIWDAADAADNLFQGQYALIFMAPAWRKFNLSYPAGELARVTTGAAVLEHLYLDAPALPAAPETTPK